MGKDTTVYKSCSAVLNGELFVFGGDGEKYNRQVEQSYSQDSFLIFQFRSVKLTIVHSSMC